MPATAVDLEIADLIAETMHDPLKFVQIAYPWGEPGVLQDHKGPDVWQANFLKKLGEEVRARAFDGLNPVAPIRMAVSSGHGVGKSTLVAWIVNWIMATRPMAHGTVTANTSTQLETKTWAAIQTWTKRCICGHWFEVNMAKMYHPDFKSAWFCTPQTCKEENSEAFAGQHAADSTSFYIFDEDSAVPDSIHEVAEGGLTDGEPMIFLFGNPTRNTGKFYQACFGSAMARWVSMTVDSRTSRFANKVQIQEWIDDYGEDSDFVRVRVRGLPPTASDAQFIDSNRVLAAQEREVYTLPDEPLVAGVDVSGGGSAWTVCRFRRGLDARSIDPIRLTGQQTRDRNKVISILAERLKDITPGRKIAAMFVDSAFGSPIVERLHTLGYLNVHEVNFGGASPDFHQANQRAYQWNRMKEWLLRGGLPKPSPSASNHHANMLDSDLKGPGFHLNKKDQLVLESKESMIARGERSPDDGDGLSLTFAQPVSIALGRVPAPYRPTTIWG